MANDDRAELRRLAEAATHEWSTDVWIDSNSYGWRATGPHHETGDGNDDSAEPGCPDEQAAQRDAAFIAASSPSVVLGLLDEIEALRATPSVLRPLSAQQIEDALNEGAAESQAARGDNAYQYLLRERDSLRADVARLEAALREPWPADREPITWLDDGRGARIVVPFGSSSHVFDEVNARRLVAGLLRALADINTAAKEPSHD